MHDFYQTFDNVFQYHESRDIAFITHLHRQAELVYVTEGALEVTIDNQQQVLQKGELAVVFPDLPHAYATRGHSVCSLLIFDPELAGGTVPLFSERQPTRPFVGEAQVHPDVRYLLGAVQGLDRTQPAGKDLLRGYLLVIMSHLAGPLALASAQSPLGSSLQRLLRYLNQHFTQPVSLEQLSAELGISKCHLSRLFAKKIGYGLNTYLNTLRFRYACELLESTSQPVTDIAYAAGFESQSTFYRLFKELAGTTPTHYRQQRYGKTA